jgi:hypothetical protein
MAASAHHSLTILALTRWAGQVNLFFGSHEEFFEDIPAFQASEFEYGHFRAPENCYNFVVV